MLHRSDSNTSLTVITEICCWDFAEGTSTCWILLDSCVKWYAYSGLSTKKSPFKLTGCHARHPWDQDDVREEQCWASTFCLLFLLGQIWQAVFWGIASTVRGAGFKRHARPPLPGTKPTVHRRTHAQHSLRDTFDSPHRLVFNST